jgi:cytoskeletal protein CcmA (bactofilin family)
VFSRQSDKVSGQQGAVPQAQRPAPPPQSSGSQMPFPQPAEAKGATDAATSAQLPPPLNSTGMAKSVIGQDLTIIGSGLKIVSKGLLQVDGEVQGDVIGLKVVITSSGKVTGVVNAEEILVEGSVYGTIRAAEVTLAASSVVEGDLYHQSLALEQGSIFEGRSRRVEKREDLVPDLANLTTTRGAA